MEAVEKMQQFYKDKNIDVFKVSIFVPGTLLFRMAVAEQASFALFGTEDEDLYQKVKNIGRPSIILTRYHKVGDTTIREGKPCANIIGFDANALYLWCLGSPMPVGAFIRRRADNNFRPERRDHWLMMYNWLEFLNREEGLHIQHKLLGGRKKWHRTGSMATTPSPTWSMNSTDATTMDALVMRDITSPRWVRNATNER